MAAGRHIETRLARLEATVRTVVEQSTLGPGPSPFWKTEGHMYVVTYIPKSLDDRTPVWPNVIPEGWPDYVECPRCGLPRGCRISYTCASYLVGWNHRLADDSWLPRRGEWRNRIRMQLETAGFALEDVLVRGSRTQDATDVVWRELLSEYDPGSACEFVEENGKLKLRPLVPQQFAFHLSLKECEPETVS